MDTNQELEYFVERYNAAPRDYNAVAALVQAYRARGMTEEAAQFEEHLLTLTPPPRKTARARAAEAGREDVERGTGPVTLTCCALGVIGAFVWGGIKLSQGFTETLLYAVVGFGIVLFNMLPAMISEWRDTRCKWGVFALNLVLGWTVLGWVAALIWALTAPKGPRSRW